LTVPASTTILALCIAVADVLCLLCISFCCPAR
jgi:hypothetical protein